MKPINFKEIVEYYISLIEELSKKYDDVIHSENYQIVTEELSEIIAKEIIEYSHNYAVMLENREPMYGIFSYDDLSYIILMESDGRELKEEVLELMETLTFPGFENFYRICYENY